MYSGRGWVSGSKLTVKSQADAGRARPAHAAAVHLRIGDGETIDGDSFIGALDQFKVMVRTADAGSVAALARPYTPQTQEEVVEDALAGGGDW